MSEPPVLMEHEGSEPSAPAGEPQVFDKLRALARNGYVPDPEAAEGGGMLLRHESALNHLFGSRNGGALAPRARPVE